MAASHDPVAKVTQLAADMLAQSAARTLAREAKAADNRRKFPVAARLMDLFKDFDPQLTYARENGVEIRRRVGGRHAK